MAHLTIHYQRNLNHPEFGPLLREDILNQLDLKGEAGRLIIISAPRDPSLVGKTLAEVAAERELSPVNTVIELAKDGTESLLHGVLFRPIAGNRFDGTNDALYGRQRSAARGACVRVQTRQDEYGG